MLEKRAGTPVDVNGSGITDAGDTIAYTFTVENTGNVPITDVAVDDPMLDAAGIDITCTPTSLTPGDTAECEASAPYTITPDDVAAGRVANSATATGEDPDGDPITSPPDTTGTPTTRPQPGLEVDKRVGSVDDVNGSGITDAGDTITYEFTVENTGNVPVTDVAIDDPKLAAAGIDITCTPTRLAPGDTADCTASAPYTITAADVAAGSVANRATATGKDPDGTPTTSPPDTTSTPTTRPQPGLEVDKRVGSVDDVNGSGITDTGDTITYEFTVTNTGNVPITDVAVDDQMLAAADIDITCDPTRLEPGQSAECEADGPYTITAADVAAGSVANRATATGKDPDGTPTTSPPDTTTTTVVTPEPQLAVDKRAGTPVDVNGSGITDAGDTITYEFTVENTGNVPITDVAIDDPKLAAAGLDITCTPTRLAPGDTADCTASAPYTITAADVAAGSVANRATATGEDPDGTPTTSPPDTTSTPTTRPQPQLVLDKRVGTVADVNNSRITDTGDLIRYEFTATNTGNVPLTTVGVDDPMLAGQGISITCSPTNLGPGESASCVTSGGVVHDAQAGWYRITRADEARGSVTNTAVATSTDPDGGTVPSSPDSTSTPTTLAQPSLTVWKAASGWIDENGNGEANAGDTIEFTFTVRNTGNVPLTVLRVVDPKLGDGTTGPGSTFLCDPPVDLAPSEEAHCLTTGYVLTQADIDAGEVYNTATAAGTDPNGETVDSPPAETTTPLIAAPALAITKEVMNVADVNGSGLTDPGDEILYRFRVSNPGNVTIKDVTVADPMLAGLPTPITITCDFPTTPGELAPDETAVCTSDAPYVVTDADLGNSHVVNTATAHGTDPGDTPVASRPSTASVPVTRPQPLLDLQKSAGTPVDVNGSGLTDAGDTIAYTFTVTNTGNVPIDDVRIADAKLAAQDITIDCTPTRLLPGVSAQCEASAPYVVTADDVAAGAVDNSATATGRNPDGGDVDSPPALTSTPTTRPEPDLQLIKTAGTPVDVNNSGLTDAGDTIAYTFRVTNTGNVPVSGVLVDDPMLSAAGIAVTCTPTRLGPGDSADCAAAEPYRITAADVASGAVQNEAEARATDPDGGDVVSPPDTTSTPTTTPRPALEIDKAAGEPVDVNGSGITDAGDTIAYTFTVTNTGNVPIRDVEVRDPLLTAAGIAVSCPTGPLGVGESRVCTADAPYVVTEADEASGAVANTARAHGTNPDDGPVESPEDSTSTPVTTPQPSLDIDKRAETPDDVNESGLTDAGDTIVYTFTVTNTGNVPLRDVAVRDPLLIAAGLDVTCEATELSVTEPGNTTTCTSEPYTVTRADAAAGSVANTAVADSTDPDGDPVTSPPDSASVPTTLPQPALDLEKTAVATDTNGTGNIDHGDTIVFTFTVTNAGNVPIDAIDIDDPMLDAAGVAVTCPPGRLAPEESVECTSEPYTVTEDDEKAGSVHNRALATGADPDDGPVESPPDTSTTPVIAPEPEIELVKEAGEPVDVDENGVIDAGDTIAYTFTVTNTGNVPVKNVTVTDVKLESADPAITIDCPADWDGTLDPDESVTCTTSAPWVITQGEADAGEVVNTAVATATDPWDRAVTPDDDTENVPLDVPSGLEIDKEAGEPADTNDSGRVDAGDTITYTFTVRNTGSTTITDLQVVDSLITSEIVCEADRLTKGQSTTCTAAYVITQADMDAGTVENTAHAVGENPAGDPVTSNDDSTSTPLPADPALDLVKEAELLDKDGDGKADAGEFIRYTFTVTNTGNVTVTGVAIDDAMLAASGTEIACERDTLAPDESTTCRARYRVTKADAAKDTIRNVATATADSPGGPVTSPEDSASVPTDPGPGPHKPPTPDPDDDSNGPLPGTGGPPWAWLLLGLAALGSGSLLLARTRSRKGT